MDDSASFGYWVRRRRKALDLTQDALAQQVGCSVMTIRKIEADIRRPSRQIAELLAEHLALPADARVAFIRAARAELRTDLLPRPAEQLALAMPPSIGSVPDAERLAAAEEPTFSAPSHDLPAGTATFLFVDLPGSARRWEQDHQAAEADLLYQHQLLRNAVAAHSGAIYKMIGDSTYAAFASAPHALAAALAAYRALEAMPSAGGPVHARMAIHTSTAELRGAEYTGLPLNRVARLLEAGNPGQILLSRAAYELVRDSLPANTILHSLGTHRLRDLTHPEHIYQVGAPDLPAEFPPLATLDQHRTNLPIQPTPFTGRTQAVTDVTTALRQPGVRLLTLLGPGGTGKSRLALQAAAELLELFEDGVYFIELSPISNSELVITTIAQTFGVKEIAGQLLLTSLKGYLGTKQLLLLLDNFEQIVAAAPIVAELLAAAPRIKLLVTSRAALHVYGEHEYPVPPMALPDLTRLPPIEQFTQYEAVHLFIERAQAVNPDFAITNENAPAVAEICARLDGLPLAIELAAARVKLLHPQALLARLTNRLKLLTGGGRDLPARQQTLRGAIAWSDDLLEPHERTLFARLAVFIGGCTLDAAETICNAPGDLPFDALDGLTSLVDKSLLRQVDVGSGEPRFVILETVREYALERLAAYGEFDQLHAWHAVYFLALAEEAAPKLQRIDEDGWIARLEADHGNLRAALGWVLEHGDVQVATQLGAALWPFWEIHNHYAEGRRWLESVLNKSAGMASPHRALACTGAGTLAFHQGDLAAAAQFHQEALALYRQMNDKAGIAFALNNVGAQELQAGDFARASIYFTESLTLARDLDDQRTRAYTLHNLGEAARQQGDLIRAAALYDESMALFHATGDRYGIAANLTWLARVTHLQGNYILASALYRESLTLCQALGDQERMVECLEGVAHMLGAQEPSGQAAQLFGAAAAARDAIGAALPPSERRVYDQAIADARAQLGQAAFAAAWSAGRVMALEQAMRLALAALKPH